MREIVKLLTFSLIILLSINTLSAQKAKSKAASISNPKQQVIATVGKENISYADIEKAFKKNMNRRDLELHNISQDSLFDFIDLYVNYRLKVRDALSRGFDKDSSIIQDIYSNKKILAESFYYEKKLTEPAIERMSKLREYEKQIAIIVVTHKPANADTIIAYEKANGLLKMLADGVNFFGLAQDSSDDKETARRGGIVHNFITAGNIQKQIEDAVYSLKPDEVYPEPINIKFGYIILKLLKDEPRLLVKARHILLSEIYQSDTFSVSQKADSLLNLLKKGASFSKLAEENSDDPQSAANGGDFGEWYSRSTGFTESGKILVPEFVDALYDLHDGTYSGKVYTDYGIHIIIRDSTKFPEIEKEKEDIKKLYKRIYLEQDKREMLDSLKIAYGLKINEDILKAVISHLDTTKTNLDSAWARDIPAEMYKKSLYSFINKSNTIGEFLDYTKTKNELRGLSLNEQGFKRGINKLIEEPLFNTIAVELEKSYPDFAALMQEFRDGILLFKVEALEVWDKLKFDTTLAKTYYDSTKSRYRTSPAYDLTEIYMLSDSAAQEVYKLAKSTDDFEQLAEQHSQRAGYREKRGNWGLCYTKDSKIAKLVDTLNPKVGAILPPTPFERGFSIIKVNKYEGPRPKTFEEAIPDFAPEVQDILQKQLTENWIKELKNKFKVNIDKKKIVSVVGQIKKSNK